MITAELAKIAKCSEQNIRAKTKLASQNGSEFVEFDGIKYSFELVRSGRGRPAYHYKEFIKEIHKKTSNKRDDLTLDEKAKNKLDTKLKVISLFHEYKQNKKGTIPEFVKYIQDELDIHYTLKMHYDWVREYKKKGALALVDKRGAKKGIVRALSTQQQRFIISMFRAYGAGEINFKQVWEELHKHEAEVAGFDYIGWKLGRVKNICSYSVVQRFLQNYYEQRVIEYTLVTKGEDFNKSYNQPALGNRKEQFTYKNECWEIDSTPADVIIFHEGKQIRPDILAIKDVYTGRVVATLAQHSNSLAIIRLLWKAIDELGMPKTIKGDNGKDYLSKQFQRLLDHLGIKYDKAIAYAGDEKGGIERHFRTLQHSYMSVLVGFIGHNVAHRQKIEQQTAKKNRTAKDKYNNPVKTQTDSDKLLSWQEFDDRLQEAVILWEIDKKRRSGLSPIEKWNACLKEITKISYESFLIYAGGYTKRRVQKDGVHLDGMRFISHFISKYRKQEVYVSKNIDNISEIFVFDIKGEFLGVAVDATVSAMSVEDFIKIKKTYNKEVSELQKGINSDKASMRTRSSGKADLQKAKKALKESLTPIKEVVLRDVELEKRTKQKRLESNIVKYIPTVDADDEDPFLQFG